MLDKERLELGDRGCIYAPRGCRPAIGGEVADERPTQLGEVAVVARGSADRRGTGHRSRGICDWSVVLSPELANGRLTYSRSPRLNKRCASRALSPAGGRECGEIQVGAARGEKVSHRSTVPHVRCARRAGRAQGRAAKRETSGRFGRWPRRYAHRLPRRAEAGPQSGHEARSRHELTAAGGTPVAGVYATLATAR